MKIPEYYYNQPDFWRRLWQITEKLLQQVRFPQRRYDDDIDSLIEDAIQDMFVRVLAKDEPEEPIRHWPAFLRRVLYYVILDQRDRAFEAHEAGWQKISGRLPGDDEDELIAVEEQVSDPSDPIDSALQDAELPQLDESEMRIVDPRFWRLVDEELPGISDEQCRECFRRFANLVWREGFSRRAAWRQVQPTCHGNRLNTFCIWLNSRLALAVMKRWAEGESHYGGGA